MPLFEKYDRYVPAELIRKGFACGVLNIGEMKRRIGSWNGEIAGGAEENPENTEEQGHV